MSSDFPGIHARTSGNISPSTIACSVKLGKEWGDEMSNLYRVPSIDASYQILFHLAKRFQRRGFFFRNRPIRNKNCLWRPCLLTDLDKMSFGSFGLAVSEEIFRNRPTRNMNCLCWTYLLTGGDEMGSLCRGPSIDASYQVSVHLAKWFQRKRLKCEKLTDNRRKVMTKAHIAFARWVKNGDISLRCVVKWCKSHLRIDADIQLVLNEIKMCRQVERHVPVRFNINAKQ